jgi:hypothetical protein
MRDPSPSFKEYIPHIFGFDLLDERAAIRPLTTDPKESSSFLSSGKVPIIERFFGSPPQIPLQRASTSLSMVGEGALREKKEATDSSSDKIGF